MTSMGAIHKAYYEVVEERAKRKKTICLFFSYNTISLRLSVVQQRNC